MAQCLAHCPPEWTASDETQQMVIGSKVNQTGNSSGCFQDFTNIFCLKEKSESQNISLHIIALQFCCRPYLLKNCTLHYKPLIILMQKPDYFTCQTEDLTLQRLINLDCTV